LLGGLKADAVRSLVGDPDALVQEGGEEAHPVFDLAAVDRAAVLPEFDGLVAKVGFEVDLEVPAPLASGEAFLAGRPHEGGVVQEASRGRAAEPVFIGAAAFRHEGVDLPFMLRVADAGGAEFVGCEGGGVEVDVELMEIFP